MKKMLFGFLGLLLIGAGCVPIANAPVNGPWQLAFDAPEGWKMVAPYDVNSLKPVDENVVHDLTEVWLQSGSQKICFSSGGPCPEGTVTNGEQIRISKIDSHRVLPKEREALKDGFSRVRLCEDGGDCTIGGAGNWDYYLESEAGNFKFEYFGELQDIEPIIESAKRVTHFTDTNSIQLKTE